MSETKAISTRGRIFTGIVTSDKMSKTVTVEWARRKYIPKYERYQKRRTKVKAHNSPEINAEKGDTVEIMETRPISKTKNFTVIKIVKKHNNTEVQPIEEKKKVVKKAVKK
ncbi:MAG: 30S ribosomal protein S17 [Candidatus Woesearchaeota archaeon]|jgi:small subunit ribosomal protein S17